ncbi:hypothetical protein U27_05121 [Candidatus Vecturithrix granuli]|uniref:Uncharacterized protein n=1 Tax=Vecturithrix granuli TaxID=1499967 RepID=A0A081C0P3_VECG1|nr:hypothetical protein U27_05121 [Candidatus Vecturithrix granuli]
MPNLSVRQGRKAAGPFESKGKPGCLEKVARLFVFEGRRRAFNTKSHGASLIYGGTFTFLLVKDGKVIEAVGIAPQGNLAQSISFKKAFTSKEEFDGILVNYQIKVK